MIDNKIFNGWKVKEKTAQKIYFAQEKARIQNFAVFRTVWYSPAGHTGSSPGYFAPGKASCFRLQDFRV